MSNLRVLLINYDSKNAQNFTVTFQPPVGVGWSGNLYRCKPDGSATSPTQVETLTGSTSTVSIPSGEMWAVVTDDDLQITSLPSLTRVIGCPGSLAWPAAPSVAPGAYGTDFTTRYANFCNTTSGSLSTLDIQYTSVSGNGLRANVSNSDGTDHSVTVSFTGRTSVDLLQCDTTATDPDDALGTVTSGNALTVKAGEIYGYWADAVPGTALSLTVTTANANWMNVWANAGKDPWPPPPAAPGTLTYSNYIDRMAAFDPDLSGGTAELLTATFHAR